MADPDQKSSPSKSYSVFLCKSVFIVLVLVSLPLFPSQAPNFINQTLLTKLWELLHLLFIGIAVSYGLFGRKTAATDPENQPKLDSSQAYLSGISHISSIFDNGYENPYGSDEKRMIQNRNPRYLEDGYEEDPYGFDVKRMIQTQKSQLLESEWRKPGSLNFQKDLETAFIDEKKVSVPESMVFVSQVNSVLDEWGENRKWEIGYKPLGLPVRSLRSTVVDHDIPEYTNGNGKFSADSKGSCKNSGKFGNGKFRGLTPINLDQKFKETVSLSSLSRDSRPDRSEVREVREGKSSGTTFVSVGESESDHIKSQSFWSPIFRQTSPKPSPTGSKEITDSEKEGFEGNDEESSPSVPMKTRGFSIGSFSEMEVQKKLDEKLKGFSKSMREDPLGRRRNWSVESWKTEGTPKSPVKTFRRGKSVRTIRASENAFECSKIGDVYPDHLEGKEVRKETSCDKFESRPNLDDFPPNPRSKLSKHQDRERREFVKTNEVESEMGSESEFKKFQESEFEKFQVSSAEEQAAQSEIANGEELDPNEVDKKAGEFIAKFREQIRLQKIASIKGFNG